MSHIMTCYERKWTHEKASRDRQHETTSKSLSHTDECNAIPLRVFESVWFGRYDTISAKVKSKGNNVGAVLRVKQSSLSHSLTHSYPQFRQIECPISLFGECPSTIRPPPTHHSLSLSPPILSVSLLDPCTLCLSLSCGLTDVQSSSNGSQQWNNTSE